MSADLWERLSAAVRDIPAPRDDLMVELPSHLEDDDEIAAFQAFTDLAASSAHWTKACDHISEILGEHPRLAPVAVTAALNSEQPEALVTPLTSLVNSWYLSLDLLSALSGSIPYGVPYLNELAVIVQTDLTKALREQAEHDPDEWLESLALSLKHLSVHLGDVGHGADAVLSAEEAVAICRRLARTDIETYRPLLADVIDDLAVALQRTERHDRAVECQQEAIAHYRILAATDPDTYVPILADMLVRLWRRLTAAGADGLPALAEAVGTYRDLAAETPERYVPLLADLLKSLADGLKAAGRDEEALAVQRATS
ncbi:tetratricopeptide repeat protein [Sphaerisporangium perillae]|uniref:tetratricopeptide repeat protein n=1 Tax=Sphaerisporangium perillae TaxID=2935860 RepID=UPI00200E2D40|nr:tetratricopeptide repeat protein [Sphaerisporangium perillae]